MRAPGAGDVDAGRLRGHTDLAVGNVAGSNLFNLLLALGATRSFSPHPIPVPNVALTLGFAARLANFWELGVQSASKTACGEARPAPTLRDAQRSQDVPVAATRRSRNSI